MRLSLLVWFLFSVALILPRSASASGPLGYYRQPTLHDTTIYFVAEGDIWKVGESGGAAIRMTSHPGDELYPAVSPDGSTLAFVGTYEGPAEVYTMPVDGGKPTRRTYGAGRIRVVGWTADGKVLFNTTVRSTLPNRQLAVLDVSRPDRAGVFTLLPLAQAADGVYDNGGSTLFFTRFSFQGSHTKRYQGGTAQNIWKYTDGDPEAIPLTSDYPGTSKRPMWWQGRVYFASDRDGTMNLWSMLPDGTDLVQHTHHIGWDIASPSLWGGKIVYQLGADIHCFDIAAGTDRMVPITLDSDLDQTREHWIQKPLDYLTAVHLSPKGDRVVLTARGQVFTAFHRQGRLAEVTRRQNVRYRNARFLPDGKSLVALSDESGEVELWRLPANGVGEPVQLTTDGDVLRWEAVPSPDGKYIAHHDKNFRLFLFDVEAKKNRLIDRSTIDRFRDLRWSPDSKWLAYAVPAENLFQQIKIYSVDDGTVTALTTDRFDSYSPAWSADGKWIYFLSDRNLQSVVKDVWGSYEPEPFLDKTTEIYQIPLVPGLRSPFTPDDELNPGQEKTKPEERDTSTRHIRQRQGTTTETGKAETAGTRIDLHGIQARIRRVPIDPGNYTNLMVNDDALFWLSTPTGQNEASLVGAAITNHNLEVKTLVEGVKRAELSQDGKKLLVRKGETFYIIDAAPGSADLDKRNVSALSSWKLSVIPREEWHQMFVEAWRLERDYFYDRNMHGVDWKATLHRYLPLVDRVTTRAELSDLIGQMVSELSALHTFVYGGDMRRGPDRIMPSSLGAVLTRDENAGGYRVDHVYLSDPDQPDRASPLRRPGVNIGEGDVIEMVNGTSTLSVPDIGMLLRHQVGRQVLLRVQPVGGDRSRDVIVKPISMRKARDLRYHEWEYTRRLEVEKLGKGEIGYVHLRAMGGDDFTDWAREYYPVFTRKGLIVDVRHNLGGDIDSWILEKLLRKVWFYWSQTVGWAPNWNMQYAFRGHIVVLCDERTSSDGEAFSEGFRRLGLGKVIGTRTWGGEIWLSSDNFLVDGGIATAAEYGVYGPEGKWLIEGHGVDPDMVVDNLPHATFKGKDAQLESAVSYLQQLIREKPVTLPERPPFPDKSLR